MATKTQTQKRLEGILEYFRKAMPAPRTELHYGSPFQLLVAVILSAQCTDQRVNQVTPGLFRAFPDAATMSQATEEALLELMGSVSYPRSKARHLLSTAGILHRSFHGAVPEAYEDLIRLPGVGRKTANVISSVVFHKATLAVDTHVFRVAHRLGLATARDRTPLDVEIRLTGMIPQGDIPDAHHWLLLHGRYVCTARTPKCPECAIRQFCSSWKRSERKAGKES